MFPYFNSQGGPYGMHEVGDNTLELCMDVSSIYNYTDYNEDLKLFLCVEKENLHGGSGEIISCSFIDENNTEYHVSTTNIPIATSITYASTILPSVHIPQNIYVNSTIGNDQVNHGTIDSPFK